MDNLQKVGKAIVFIEDNLRAAISVKEIADSVFTSYYHFHRIFQAVTGETIGGYVRKRRLSRAADELVYSERGIIDIAFDYQFESQEAFSRAFKKFFGLTPYRFRKERLRWVTRKLEPITEDVLSHLSNGVSLEPEIVTIEEMDIIGIGGTTAIINNRIPYLWENFCRRMGEIESASSPFVSIGLCEYFPETNFITFTEESDYYVITGLKVDSTEYIPPGMITRRIPSGRFAVFTHIGPISTLYHTYKYIWGIWADNRRYEVDERSDFELYEADYAGPESAEGRIRIYIPLK